MVLENFKSDTTGILFDKASIEADIAAGGTGHVPALLNEGEVEKEGEGEGETGTEEQED